jgi:hypothetical protein
MATLTEVVRGFVQSLLEKPGIILQIRPLPLHSAFLSVHYSLTMPSFNVT